MCLARGLLSGAAVLTHLSKLQSSKLCVQHLWNITERFLHRSIRMRQDGTWDLGPFAAVLAPGQTSPQATEYKETRGTKITGYMHSWGK